MPDSAERAVLAEQLGLQKNVGGKAASDENGMDSLEGAGVWADGEKSEEGFGRYGIE